MPNSLLAAYQEVTGIPLSMSYARQLACTQLMQLGFTAEDVKRVVKDIKRRVDAGEKGYSDRSLSFSNCMGNIDTFEERAITLRMRLARLKPRETKDVAVERQIGDSKVVYLDQDKLIQKEPTLTDPAAALRSMAGQIQKRA